MKVEDQQEPSPEKKPSAPKDTENNINISPLFRKVEEYYECRECDYTSYNRHEVVNHYIGIKQVKNENYASTYINL